jgi:hypothetical protein
LDAAVSRAALATTQHLRFAFNQYDNYAIPTDGIAIDDVSVVETYERRFTLNQPAAIDENAGPVTATLSVMPALRIRFTVPLSSSLPGQLAIPPSVAISAGAIVGELWRHANG